MVGTFNQSLQCTQDVFIGFQAPSPPVPMLVVHKKKNMSYIIAELNSAQSQQHVAGFCLVPYFPRHRTKVPIVSNIPDEDQDNTVDDPTEIASPSDDYVSLSEDDSSDEDASSNSS